MSGVARHDAWQAGDSYDGFMGRWSRQIAPRFLDWLEVPERLDWLEVGCGTGALSAAIVARCNPRSLIAIDPSEGFIATARRNVADQRAEFRVADAQALPLESASRDAIASALALNFVPDRDRAMAEIGRVARPGATIGFYVWDYPGGGLQFVDAVWQTAVALDPAAQQLAENRRFPFCTPEGLCALAARAGLTSVECSAIEIPTVFKDFDDYWLPFTWGAGPVPGYCASLAPDARERLRLRLHDTLPRGEGGTIALTARAWAIKAKAA
jgi:SAM-dependent methyltransferase